MSDLVRRLNDYWPDDGDFGPTKLCREAAIALMAAQERNKRLELENEELRGACLAEAMQATPLTPHGAAIAAGDGTLHGAIDYWQERALRAENAVEHLQADAGDLQAENAKLRKHAEAMAECKDLADGMANMIRGFIFKTVERETLDEMAAKYRKWEEDYCHRTWRAKQ